MLLYKQLELFSDLLGGLFDGREQAPLAHDGCKRTPPLPSGRDAHLEAEARAMLQAVGAVKLIPLIRVVWSARLRTAAGRADYHRTLITLNPRLHEHGER